MSGMQAGRDMYRAKRGPRVPQPVDVDTIRHNGIAQGRAMHRAARSDPVARAALDALAAERGPGSGDVRRASQTAG